MMMKPIQNIMFFLMLMAYGIYFALDFPPWYIFSNDLGGRSWGLVFLNHSFEFKDTFFLMSAPHIIIFFHCYLFIGWAGQLLI